MARASLEIRLRKTREFVRRMLPWAVRWFRRALWVGAVALGLLLTALSALTLTPPGRAFVLRMAVDQANGLIPGSIEAGGLERLNLWGVELRGLKVLDPQGEEVARVDHLAIESDLSALLDGSLALSSVLLEGAWVDLRVLEERRGLLAAFVDPDAPPSPPSAGPPPNIIIRSVDLRDVRVRLPEQDPGGQVDVTVDELEGSFELIEGESEVDLTQLMGHVDRSGERLLDFRATAHLPRARAPTRIEVELSSGPTALSFSAEALLPTHEKWEAEPLSAHLHMEGLSAAHLAKLLQDPSIEEAFLGQIEVHLDAEGTARDLTLDGALDTAGGTLSFDEFSASGDLLRVELSTDGVQLSQLRSDLPPRKVAFQLSAQTRGLPPEPVSLSLALREARIDGEPLVDLDMSARFEDEMFRKLEVRGKSGKSRIDVDGSAGLDGAADLALRADLRPVLIQRLAALFGERLTGHLQTKAQIQREPDGRLAAEGRIELLDFARPAAPLEATPSADDSGQKAAFSVERLAADFSLRGTPPDISTKLSATLEGAVLGEQHVDDAELWIQGGMQGLDIEMKARGGSGPPPTEGRRSEADNAEIHMNARVTRGQAGTTLTAHASGSLAGRDIVLNVQPTTIADDGALTTEGLEVALAGQRLRLSGESSAGTGSSGLDVEWGPIELSQWSSLAGVSDLVGTVYGKAHLAGTTRLPLVDLELTGSGLGLQGKPLAKLSASAHFDAESGAARVEARMWDAGASSTKAQKNQSAAPDGVGALETGARMALGLRAEASFQGGENYATSLLESNVDAHLQVEHLHTDFLTPYLPPGVLPVDAQLSAELHAFGTMNDPRLESSSRLTLLFVEEPVAELVHEMEYAKGELRTELELRHSAGRWAELRGAATLPGDPPGIDELPDALERTAAHGRWELHLSTQERSLQELEFLSLLTNPEKLPPFVTSLQVDATHEPGQEPNIDLHFSAEQAKAHELASCSAQSLQVEVSARHRESDNELRIVGREAARELFELKAEMPLALQPLLEGAALQLGALDVTLESRDLELASLPFVCGRLSGQLSASVEGQDLIGKAPELVADLRASEFSLGSSETLNLAFRAEAGRARAKAELTLQEAKGSTGAKGHLRAALPWTFSEGRVQLSSSSPFDASIELDRLPLAPLLPPRGALSYLRGTVDAAVEASGEINSPRVTGEIAFTDVAFTSTSLAQPLRDVQARLSLEGRTVRLKHFEAHDRDGVVTMQGHVNFENLEQVESQVEITAEDFPLRQRGQVVAVTNLNAVTKTTITPEETRATLTLRDVDTWLESVALRKGIDLAAHPEFVVDGVPAEGSALAEAMIQTEQGAELRGANGAPEQDDAGTPLYLTIDADQRFWVKRTDFAVKLAALLETKIEDDEVRVKGEVTIDRGYLQLFGKVFDLSRESQLRFIGSTPPNPVLQLQAEHQTPGGSVVAVRISGRANAPELQFSIDGNQVEAGEAVQELFGTDRASGGESDAGAQTKSFVSGLTAGVLATAARRELGAAAPIIMIDPAEESGEGRVRAGFELDDIIPGFLRPIVTGAYLEGIVARESDGESSQAETEFGALLELYFPENLFTAGQYGPGTTWSVDFGWRL